MAKGYPDFFGQRIFPRYGGANIAAAAPAVDANAVTTLLTVLGAGVCYTGVLFVDPGAVVDNDRFRIWVDGTLISSTPHITYLENAWHEHNAAIMYLQYFDQIAGRVSYSIYDNIPFLDSIVVDYTETYGRTPVVHAALVYTLIL